MIIELTTVDGKKVTVDTFSELCFTQTAGVACDSLWATFTSDKNIDEINSVRTVDTGCPFEVSFAVVFANNRPLAVTRFSDSKNYNYMAFAGKLANSTGIKLKNNGQQLTVSQSASAVLHNEYVNLNEAGVAYCYVMFR